MKRYSLLFCVALLLTLVFHILPGSAAATQASAQLTMSCAEDFVHGDTVKVVITSDQMLTNQGVGITLFYDGSVLTLDRDNSKVQSTSLEIHGPLKVNGKTAVRISCLPGTVSNSFTSGQPLAELIFKASAPVEQTSIEMSGVHQYKPAVEAAAASPVVFRIAPIPVTGITLNKSSITMEIQQTEKLIATVIPEEASEQKVIWTSSDTSVVSVKDGVLTSQEKTGTATITATTKDGGFTASCHVEVTMPPYAGYFVSMPGTQSAAVDGTVRIAPVITNADVSEFNAYHMTFSYDPTLLQLHTLNTTDDGFKIEETEISDTERTIQVLRYGDTKSLSNAGTAPFELKFKPKVTGKATVTLLEARVDYSENALIENASKAIVLPSKKKTEIIIGGYRVTLNDAFATEDILEVEPMGTFRFQPTASYYEYDLSESTMGINKKPVRYEKTADGDVIIHFGIRTSDLDEFIAPDNGRSFIINNVAGELKIILNEETDIRGRTYNVTIDGSAKTSFRGAATATYGIDYVLTQIENGNFNHPIIRGLEQASVERGTNDEGQTIFVIDGDDIKADFIIDVSGISGGTEDEPDEDDTTTGTDGTTSPTETTQPDNTRNTYKVQFAGAGKAEVVGDDEATEGSDYVFQLDEKTGYTYSVSVTIGGQSYDCEEEDGIYIIDGAAITGKIVITVGRTKATSGTTSTNTSTNKTTTSTSTKTQTTEKKQVAVTFDGSGAEDAEGSKTATQSQAYTFKIRQQAGFQYSISVKVGGKDGKYTYDETEDAYTIAANDVTGDIGITIEKTSIVAVSEYVSLDGRSLHLVMYTGEVPKGQIPQYDGNNMYWSESYKAYTWLVESHKTEAQIRTEAIEKITFSKADKAVSVDVSGNVDLSKETDAEDAWLAWEIYMGKHDLNMLGMQKLLAADAYPDGKINVQDVAVILGRIRVQEEGDSADE